MLHQRVGCLGIAGDFDGIRLGDAQLLKPFFGGQDQRGVAIGDLRAVIGLERQSIHHVAIHALDFERLLQRDLDLVHLRVRVMFCVSVFGDGDVRQVGFGGAVRLEIALHDFGKEMGEHEDLAGAIVGMREVSQGVAN
jgi:hypothetical protein